MYRPLRPCRPSRGAATLITVLGLSAACAVALGFMARALGSEHRGLSERWRTALAREAAESGQQWARVQLNAGRLNAQCQPSNLTQDIRWVDHRPAGASSLMEATLNAPMAATPAAPVASCAYTAARWQCQCAHNGTAASGSVLSVGSASPTAPEGPAAHFDVALQSTGTPHTLIVHTWGCASTAAACGASAAGLPGRAHLQTSWGWVPLLRVMPHAALTAHGHIHWSGPASSLAHAQPTPGATLVRAAGAWHHTVDASLAEAAAQPLAADWAVSTQDPWLKAALSGDAALSRWLGSGITALVSSGQVRRLHCAPAQCAQQLLEAWSAHPDATWWIDQPLVVQEPLAVGSAERPVLLVISGHLQLLSPGARLRGVVIMQPLSTTVQGPGSVEGAMIALGDVQTVAHAAPPAVVFNPEVVQRVRDRHGLWAPIPGSWRDY